MPHGEAPRTSLVALARCCWPATREAAVDRPRCRGTPRCACRTPASAVWPSSSLRVREGFRPVTVAEVRHHERVGTAGEVADVRPGRAAGGVGRTPRSFRILRPMHQYISPRVIRLLSVVAGACRRDRHGSRPGRELTRDAQVRHRHEGVVGPAEEDHGRAVGSAAPFASILPALARRRVLDVRLRRQRAGEGVTEIRACRDDPSSDASASRRVPARHRARLEVEHRREHAPRAQQARVGRRQEVRAHPGRGRRCRCAAPPRRVGGPARRAGRASPAAAGSEIGEEAVRELRRVARGAARMRRRPSGRGSAARRRRSPAPRRSVR